MRMPWGLNGCPWPVLANRLVTSMGINQFQPEDQRNCLSIPSVDSNTVFFVSPKGQLQEDHSRDLLRMIEN